PHGRGGRGPHPGAVRRQRARRHRHAARRRGRSCPGSPLPAGEAPAQLAVGPAGELLVAPAPPAPSAAPGAGLTSVARGPRRWAARPVPLEPGARAPLLAGGGRYALVAYEAGDAPAGQEPRRCRLALFDLPRGRLGPPRGVCAGPETVVALAAGGDD